MGGQKTFVITFIPIYFQTHKYSYRSFVCVCVSVVCVCMTHVHVKVQSSPSSFRPRGAQSDVFSEGIISRLLVNVNISLFFGRWFCNDNDNNNNTIMTHHGGGGCLYTI